MSRFARPAWLLLAPLVALALAPAAPAAASRCTAKKLAVTAVYFGALARCESKAVRKAAALDPLCVARAQQKFFAKLDHAERKPDCLTLGDAVPVQDVVDDAFSDAVAILEEPAASVCCETGQVAVWTSDAAACLNFGGMPGAAGTVPDPSGACVAPPAAGGPCCGQFPAFGCVSTPLLTESACKDEGGSFRSGAVCHPTLQCVVPGGKPRSRCTARKYVLIARYVRAVSACEARAVKKGGVADTICLARAQSKLLAAYAKAEGKSDCIAAGEVASAQGTLDDLLDLVFQLLEPPPAVCCQGIGLCGWFADETTCTSINGTPGPPGSVCDAVTGVCGAPPSADGGCCEDAQLGGETTCLAGPSVDSLLCAGNSGTYVPDAVCLPARLCID